MPHCHLHLRYNLTLPHYHLHLKCNLSLPHCHSHLKCNLTLPHYTYTYNVKVLHCHIATYTFNVKVLHCHLHTIQRLLLYQSTLLRRKLSQKYFHSNFTFLAATVVYKAGRGHWWCHQGGFPLSWKGARDILLCEGQV